MKRPARFCLCIATLTTMMTIGGARGALMDSFLAYKSRLEVENGSVLKLFFNEIARHIANGKWQPRHVTILSHINDDLDDAIPFCENYSCILSKRLIKFQPSKAFNANSLIVRFRSFKNLSQIHTERFKNHREILVMRGPVSVEEVTELFRRSRIASIGQTFVVVDEGSSVKLYVPKPTAGCQIETRLLSTWRPGVKIPELRSFGWFVGYRDCLVTVSTSNQMPSMKVENVSGRMTITGGIEGNILMIAAEKMNFNIEVNYLANINDANVSIQEKIVENVAQRRSDLGIGQIRMTDRVANSLVDVTDSYIIEQVRWAIPRLDGGVNDVMTFEFSWPIWVLILFVFSMMIGCGHVFQSVSRANLEAARRRGQGRTEVLITRERLRNRRRSTILKKSKSLGTIILDMFSVCLGFPVLVDPITTSARILLFTFLYYAIVITTAYKSSLSSLLTVEIAEPLITDVNGIIAANLTTGGEIKELEVLKDQVNASPSNRALIQRYVVYQTREAARNRVTVNRDFAYLSLLSDITYDTHVWGIIDLYSQYQILPEKVSTYNSIIVWQPNTVLQLPIQKIALRSREAGLIEYWRSLTLNSKIKAALTTETVVNARNNRGTMAKYSPIFVQYAVCILISPLVFLAELLIHKFA